MVPEIAIIMTTYNGAPYLPQQLSSILEQTYKEWRLFIRDDYSTDNTITIIEEYANRYLEKIKVIEGEKQNVGIPQSFLLLLNEVESDYIMFCDQDDVWLPDKIKNTFNKMREIEDRYGENTPALIHTDLAVVAEDLRALSDSLWDYQHLNPEKGKTLNRLLVQNVITGCTVMINKPLKNRIHLFPEQAIMHDWWAALVAAAFGKIDYVPMATILYRQHDESFVGAKEWGAGYALKMARSGRSHLKATLQKTQLQARAFLDTFRDELTGEYRNLLGTYSELDQQDCFTKRFNLIKYGFFKIGLLKNIGLFLAV
jgi:glycosyltransferase involved in cell wall biosynthesis